MPKVLRSGGILSELKGAARAAFFGVWRRPCFFGTPHCWLPDRARGKRLLVCGRWGVCCLGAGPKQGGAEWAVAFGVFPVVCRCWWRCTFSAQPREAGAHLAPQGEAGLIGKSGEPVFGVFLSARASRLPVSLSYLH